jgi:two-component system, LytTR family, response regulator
LRGFDLQVADYLLKPFSFARFIQAVERVQKITGPSVSREFIFIKTEQRLERIPLLELLYIEGMRDYRQLHLESRRLLTPQTFHEFEDQFTPQVLCRVHKSFMVAINKIDRIEKDEIQIGSHRIPISETYKRSFFEGVDKLNGNR